ncbi:hypothetical protein Pfo_019194, partial [Paulownia fortunei]
YSGKPTGVVSHGHVSRRQNPILEVLKLGLVVLGTSAVVWWPYLYSTDVPLEDLTRTMADCSNHLEGAHNSPLSQGLDSAQLASFPGRASLHEQKTKSTEKIYNRVDNPYTNGQKLGKHQIVLLQLRSTAKPATGPNVNSCNMLGHKFVEVN